MSYTNTIKALDQTKLTTIKRFQNPEEAKLFQTTLKNEGVESVIFHDKNGVDITFALNNLDQEFQLKVHENQFSKAKGILEQKASEAVDHVASDHYLFDFNNEELYAVLLKSDEWSDFDVALSKKILKDRGEEISEDLLASLKSSRIADLAKPEEGQRPWIVAGYFFAFTGGILGLILGWYMWKGKKTLPDGQKTLMYDDDSRWHGKSMFIIGCIFFTLFTIIYLIAEINYWS